MTDASTGISFSPKINGLDLFGVGVRKKGPIKVYSVGLYATSQVKNAMKHLSAKNDTTKALATLASSVSANPPTTFLLQMNFHVGAEKMVNAIAESVLPRHNKAANASQEVDALKQLIFNGLSKKEGAVKGTTFQFDCTKNGVDVTVNQKKQGRAGGSSLSKAFCDVYLDDKSVSPPLKSSCLEHLCMP